MPTRSSSKKGRAPRRRAGSRRATSRRARPRHAEPQKPGAIGSDGVVRRLEQPQRGIGVEARIAGLAITQIKDVRARSRRRNLEQVVRRARHRGREGDERRSRRQRKRNRPGTPQIGTHRPGSRRASRSPGHGASRTCKPRSASTTTGRKLRYLLHAVRQPAFDTSGDEQQPERRYRVGANGSIECAGCGRNVVAAGDHAVSSGAALDHAAWDCRPGADETRDEPRDRPARGQRPTELRRGSGKKRSDSRVRGRLRDSATPATPPTPGLPGTV